MISLIGEGFILAALLLPLSIHLLSLMHKPLRRYSGYIGGGSILLSVGMLLWIWTAIDNPVLSLPNLLVVGLNFRLDGLAIFFAALFGGTGALVSIFNGKYMDNQNNTARFFLFTQLTLLGCMGVVLAADLLTLFFFFELMTFSSYVLVIHSESRPAISAGNTYLFMGVAGGLVLLLGIIFLYSATGTTAFQALPAAAGVNSTLLFIAGFCFMIGFGIKTGVVPLHIWMPKAYFVSPVSVNAVSSGIMIKTGAYGLLRVYQEVFFVEGTVLEFGPIFGWVFLWLGLISMFTGAFIALRQNNMLKTLAYSSISQIGYILMGLGVILLPHGKNAYGLTGMLFHVLNHTVFKGTLFLIAAVIVYYAGTADYSKLGGILRRSPVLGSTFVIAALGIMGMPGLNGYASKTFLHHAVGELYTYHPNWLVWLAEKIFVVASAFTICYFVKLFFQVFWGEEGEASANIPARLPSTFKFSLMTGAVVIAAIGLFPGFTVRSLATPAMSAVGATNYVIEYAQAYSIWSFGDLWGMVITALIGAGLYFLVIRFKFDYLPIPNWLSIERLFYRPIAQGFLLFCMGPGVIVDRKVNQIYHGTGGLSYTVCRAVGLFDRSIDNLYSRAGTFSSEVCRSLGIMDRQFSNLYDKVARQGHIACINLSGFDQNLDKLYTDLGLVATRAVNKVSAMDSLISSSNPLPLKTKNLGLKKTTKKDSVTWHIANLNVEAIVVAVALVVVVVIFVFYGR